MKHLITASRAKAMKSGFSYSLPTLGLLSILMLPLAGHADTKKPGAVFKDCETCPEMVVIPAGSFKMGAAEENKYELYPGSGMIINGTGGEKPVHEVKIGYSFAVGKYEVTQAEWEGVMGNNPSEFKGAQMPVHKVSWEDAKSFIKKLSEQTGKEYRLLSESEWEYMARAGSTTLFHWGGEIDSSKARYDKKDKDGTVRVGSYSANAFGVYDTAGNVWEWVEDCYTSGYEGAPSDGSAWTSTKDVSSNSLNCKVHMERGGGYNSEFFDLRSAARNWIDATERHSSGGFRIARTLSQ